MSKLASMERELKRLKDEIQKLKPLTAPGTMTSKTTRGTARRSTATNNQTATDTAPRWA